MSRIPDTAQLLNSRRKGVAVAACLAVAAVVAGCGGGARVKAFQPTQIIAFGDENSAFDDTSASPNPLVAVAPPTASSATAIVGSRYTINVVADAAFLCKGPAPLVGAAAICASDSDIILTLPTLTSFFLPQAGASVFGYRLSSGIPIVHEVETVDLTQGISGTTPSPVYRSVDHLHYCSVDFGNDYGNWVQRVAHGLGGGLSLGGAAGCPQDSGNGRSYAQWGAKVDDVEIQVNTNLGVLHDGVLVTMLAGQNDIMAAYAGVLSTPGTEDAAKISMREKGAKLAAIIGTIVSRGARVAYLTVPDMGKSPEAVVGGNPGLATALTKAFNEGYKASGEEREKGGLVLSVVNNGHKVVKVDTYTQIANLAASYPATAACESDITKAKGPDGRLLSTMYPAIVADSDLRAKVLLLNCTSSNLTVLSGSYTATPPTNEVRAYYGNYLWADGRRLAPIGHANLANLAVSRIRDQL